MINCGSAIKHRYEIRGFIIDNKLDALCLTETWLADPLNAYTHDLVPIGYNIISIDRARGQGGGVALIIRDQRMVLNSTPPTTLSGCEALSIKIALSSKSSLTVLIVYQPPDFLPEFNNQFLELVTTELNSASAQLVM